MGQGVLVPVATWIDRRDLDADPREPRSYDDGKTPGLSRTASRCVLLIIAFACSRLAYDHPDCGPNFPSWVGVDGVSASHSVPFQNVMRYRLHSVTRPAQGAPWLCGPVSRRVCYFVEASRRNAVSQASWGDAFGRVRFVIPSAGDLTHRDAGVVEHRPVGQVEVLVEL